MIRRSLQAKLLVFAVFFLGMAAGALLTNEYRERIASASEVRPGLQHDIRDFHDYLGLTTEQRVQVQQILDETGAEFHKLAEQTRPQSEALRLQSRSRIRAILTAEQQEKYDQYYESLRNGWTSGK